LKAHATGPTTSPSSSSTTSAGRRGFGNLLQLLRRLLVRIADHLAQPFRVLRFRTRAVEERVCHAFCTGAGCAADAVHVVFKVVREVVVDYCIDVGNIKAACGNVGGAHDVGPTLLKLLQGVIARVLALVAVNCNSAKAAVECVGQVVAHALRATKDEYFGLGAHAPKKVEQLVVFAEPAVNDLDALRNVLVSNKSIRRPDEYMHGRGLHELHRNFLHIARPCGGEKERLALLWHKSNDGLDLRLEAHVKHPVGLI